MTARLLHILTALLGAALLAPASAAALSLERIDQFDYDSPVHVSSDPGDPDRVFVVEQDGRIRVSEDGGPPALFLDIADIVISPEDEPTESEAGLLSMAFSPDHETNGLFYVFYTGTDSGSLHIDEFDSGAATIEDSRRELLTIPRPASTSHNGGQLQFGPDGYLYASTGDGCSGGGDPCDFAQNLGSRFGKLLRIDPEGAGDGDYTVPADNPFAATAGCADGCDEIWSYGLRNPWRFSFDRETGALVIGDVGQDSWEEVDYEPASAGLGRGDNFGWDCREGAHDYTGPEAPGPGSPSPECPGVGTFTEPVFEYQNVNRNCSITGGYVVRDPGLGDLYGRYVYADFCFGELRSLSLGLPLAGDDRSEGVSVTAPTSFGEDASGRIYVAELAGPVSRLTEPAAPGESPPPHTSRDTSPPDLKLDGKRRQSIRGSRAIRVGVGIDEAAEVELRAKPRGAARGKLRLGTRMRSMEAGGEATITWRLSRPEARRVRRQLRRGRKASARIKGRATDSSGNRGEHAIKIRLVRRRHGTTGEVPRGVAGSRGPAGVRVRPSDRARHR